MYQSFNSYHRLVVTITRLVYAGYYWYASNKIPYIFHIFIKLILLLLLYIILLKKTVTDTNDGGFWYISGKIQ